MSKLDPLWEQFEQDVQRDFGIGKTISSGSKPHDPGDAVDRRHNAAMPLMLDCKTTIHKGYRVDANYIDKWITKAGMFGKSFGLPIRFLEEKCPDLMLVPLADYRNLWELADQLYDDDREEKLTKKEVAERVTKLLTSSDPIDELMDWNQELS